MSIASSVSLTSPIFPQSTCQFPITSGSQNFQETGQFCQTIFQFPFFQNLPPIKGRFYFQKKPIEIGVVSFLPLYAKVEFVFYTLLFDPDDPPVPLCHHTAGAPCQPGWQLCKGNRSWGSRHLNTWTHEMRWRLESPLLKWLDIELML